LVFAALNFVYVGFRLWTDPCGYVSDLWHLVTLMTIVGIAIVSCIGIIIQRTIEKEDRGYVA